jgi:hypothetical protein
MRNELFREALEALALVDDDEVKLRLLRSAAAEIPSALVADALNIALDFAHERDITEAVSSLAPRLSPAEAEAVISTAVKIQDLELRASLLRTIAAVQPEDLLQHLAQDKTPWRRGKWRGCCSVRPTP